MMDCPRISLVTPSYNQAEYLEQTIISVVSQGYPNCEYIVIDGGSVDGSADILRKYEKHLAFWDSALDRGQSEAINKGFAKCTGDILGWLNSDDTLESCALFDVAAAFANKNTKIIYGDCRITDQQGNELKIIRPGPVSVWSLLKFWKENSIPPQPSIFFRSECLRQVGHLKEELHYGMDYDLWLRMADKYQFVYVPRILSNYRFHDKSKSASEGGFNKFIPEWTRVANDFRKNKGTIFNWRYRIAVKTETQGGQKSLQTVFLELVGEYCRAKLTHIGGRCSQVFRGNTRGTMK